MRLVSIVASLITFSWMTFSHAALPIPQPNATNINSSTNISASLSSTNISDIELRAAWFQTLRKLTEEKSQKGFDWSNAFSTFVGGFVSAVVAFVTLWLTGKRDDKRLAIQLEQERERRNHESNLALKKLEIEHQQSLQKLGAEHLQQEQKLRIEHEQAKQKLAIEHRQSLEEAQLGAEITYADKLLELRLKKLELFYAPLHSLLQQSKGIYEKLQIQLLEDREHYQQRDDPNFGKVLQVLWKGKWEDWRMLDQMPVLKRDPLYQPLVAEVLRIGKEMTEIISKHGAFAVRQNVPADVTFTASTLPITRSSRRSTTNRGRSPTNPESTRWAITRES